MPTISEELHNKKKQRLASFKTERYSWWTLWREIADYYIPRRYVWLESDSERRRRELRNPKLLDNTGTNAGKVLASGMMNGITSPARTWFKLRVNGFDSTQDHEVRIWLEEVEMRMRTVMAESNFYNALAVMYLDLAFFGTAAVLIYEDGEDVIRCYNPALGEYYLGQDSRLQTNTFARTFKYKMHQIAERWPNKEYWPDVMKTAMDRGGSALDDELKISHLIEPNTEARKHGVPPRFAFREFYWSDAQLNGQLFSRNGFNEFPGIVSRWEITANDSYGASPAMEALGDVIQLQHETKRKAQGLDKQINPPVVADVQLEHSPISLLPNGVTFVTGQSQVGVQPAYTVNVPLRELSEDIREVQGRVRETFHNDLFKMISQLDTVRSATEVDARREEKLVLLGPVLQRFENEALDPAINRIFGIMDRAGLIPDPPEQIQGRDIEIQYVSILSSAQSAVGVASVERWLQLVGNLSAVYPGALNIPNFDELIRNYARDVGVPASNVNSSEQTEALAEEQQRAAAEQQALEQANQGAQASKLLSETDVGGGANALQTILGG